MSAPVMQQCQRVVLFTEHDHVVRHGPADDCARPPLAVDAANTFDQFAKG